MKRRVFLHSETLMATPKDLHSETRWVMRLVCLLRGCLKEIRLGSRSATLTGLHLAYPRWAMQKASLTDLRLGSQRVMH